MYNAYPSDVSDCEWVFAGPSLMLMTEDASQWDTHANHSDTMRRAPRYSSWRLLMTDSIGSAPVFPDDIDLLPAGPELDCPLAERVLGARVGRYKEVWSGYENWIATTPDGAQFYIRLSPHSALGAAPLWNPSTNLSDAQVLVQHLFMHSDYRSATEEGTEEEGYEATLWPQRPADSDVTGARRGDRPQHVEMFSVTGTGPTPSLAVCRAVYKAASDMRPHQMDPK